MTAPAAPVPALPDAAAVRGLLDGLLDRGVTAHVEAGPVLPGRGVRLVASYVDEQDEVRGVVLLDLPLAVVLGASLALVPARRVGEAVGDGAVPADLAENTREVLNVMATLFAWGDRHLTLADVDVAPDPVQPRTVAFLRVPGRRVDVRVSVPGYGEGVLAVVLQA